VSSSEIVLQQNPPVVPSDGPSEQSTDVDSRAAQVLRALRWLRAFSFPRRFPIVQFPNLPLALAFAAGHAAHYLRGPAPGYALAVSYLAMGVWAYLELADGVNWFRRLLGAYSVASTAIHLHRALDL
jgi:hypothetical protein